MCPDDALVIVQGEWNGWHTAFVRLRDLDDIHWWQPQGAPKPLVHAYVPCTSVVEGAIPHDCDRTPPPHRLLVCVLKCHSTAAVYSEIVQRAELRKAHEEIEADRPVTPTSREVAIASPCGNT